MKKIEGAPKKDLQFLVEGFLEKERAEMLDTVKDNPEGVKQLWDRLVAVLFKDSLWMDEPDGEDLAGIDHGKVILEYHGFLKPVWEQFKASLFDYKERVIPGRKAGETIRENLKTGESSLLTQYKELASQDSVIDWEQFYDIKLTVSFDSDHVTFYKRALSVLKNFMDLLEGLPDSDFGRCEYCEKCIVMTRSDKRYCPGCAKKKHQHEKWQGDPEGMKQTERDRYQSRRRKK